MERKRENTHIPLILNLKSIKWNMFQKSLLCSSELRLDLHHEYLLCYVVESVSNYVTAQRRTAEEFKHSKLDRFRPALLIHNHTQLNANRARDTRPSSPAQEIDWRDKRTDKVCLRPRVCFAGTNADFLEQGRSVTKKETRRQCCGLKWERKREWDKERRRWFGEGTEM